VSGREEAPASVPDSVPEEVPDTIATPEGDNEFAADEPLVGDDVTVTRPRGDAPHSEQPIRDAE
jgi:hypothetical protein